MMMMMKNPMHSTDPHTHIHTHLDERLIRRRCDVLGPVLLQADCPRLLWHGGLTLDVDGLALGLGLLLPSRILLDSLDELVSAAAVADVLA
jgi:hypothetical protein